MILLTFLEISQQVANEVGVDPPTALVGSTADTSQRMLALLRRELFSVINNYEFEELVKLYTVPTVIAQQDYNFPSDFVWFKNVTGWNTGKRFLLNGPLSAREWAQVTQYNSFSSYTYFYRLKNKKISLFPIPSTVENITFEYQSDECVIDNTQTTRKNNITADNDYAYIDGQLITLGLKWRYLQSLGMSYEEERNDYEQYANEKYSKQFTARDQYTDNYASPFAVVIPETIPFP